MAKILVVDDDSDFRAVCRALLEKRGFEVSEAGGVDEGYEKVVAEHPDLVILDVLMPTDYEGFELARRIREDLGMRKLPILMVTAVHGVKKPPYRFAPEETYLPVDVLLDKPVSPDTLLKKAEELLGTSREEPTEPL